MPGMVNTPVFFTSFVAAATRPFNTLAQSFVFNSFSVAIAFNKALFVIAFAAPAFIDFAFIDFMGAMLLTTVEESKSKSKQRIGLSALRQHWTMHVHLLTLEGLPLTGYFIPGRIGIWFGSMLKVVSPQPDPGPASAT